MSEQPPSNDIVADLRARYECTAGYTRDIYTPEHRDLDVRAADEIERLRRHLRQKSDQISRLQDAVQSHQAGTAERTALEPLSNESTADAQPLASLPEMCLAGDVEPTTDVYIAEEVLDMSLSQRRAWQDSQERASQPPCANLRPAIQWLELMAANRGGIEADYAKLALVGLRAPQPPEAGMYCRRCDARHARTFCPDCGLRLIPADPTPQTKEVTR